LRGLLTLRLHFLLLGTSPLELLSLRFDDTINVLFLLFVFIFGVSVGSSIGEVALSAQTGEVPAFWVSLIPSTFSLLLHSNQN
jgi:hypothetical protein